MKTSFCTFILLLLASAGFSQSPGFYVSDGKTKIAELTCYEFDNLSVVFKVLPEMNGYDYFNILVEERAEGTDNASTSAATGMEGNVFKAKYKGKKTGNIVLFKKGTIKCELESGDLTRIMMKYAVSDKGMNGGYLKFSILGYTIDGYKDELVGNSVHRSPTYSSPTTLYESDNLPLKNRTLTNRFKKAFAQKMDLTVPCNPPGVNSGGSSADEGDAPTAENPFGNQPDGPFQQKYPTGEVQVTGAFKNKKPDGVFKLYYKNGKVKEEETYINGLEEGLETQYSEDGKILIKTTYAGGKKNGERIYFNEDGTKSKMETYKDEQLNGPYKEWSKGKLSVSGNYVNGIKDGPWKQYDATGTKVVSTENWKDGATE